MRQVLPPVLPPVLPERGRRPSRRAFVLASLVLFATGCPKPPTAVLPSIATASDLQSVKDAFNADAEHRRVLVLLSPT